LEGKGMRIFIPTNGGKMGFSGDLGDWAEGKLLKGKGGLVTERLSRHQGGGAPQLRVAVAFCVAPQDNIHQLDWVTGRFGKRDTQLVYVPVPSYVLRSYDEPPVRADSSEVNSRFLTGLRPCSE